MLAMKFNKIAYYLTASICVRIKESMLSEVLVIFIGGGLGAICLGT